MVKRSLSWNLDCWYLDFPAPKRDSKRYVFLPSRKWSCTTVHIEFPTMSDGYGGLAVGQTMVKDASLAKREVLSHAKIFVRNGNRGFTRHGIFRKYLQTEHNRYQEIIWKKSFTWISTNLDFPSKNSLMSFETDGSMQIFPPPGKAGREWTWPTVAAMSAGCFRSKITPNFGLSVDYLWIICELFTDYLWMFLPFFLWKTFKVDWFWRSKSKSSQPPGCHGGADHFVPAAPWDRKCCMVVISLDNHTNSCACFL